MSFLLLLSEMIITEMLQLLIIFPSPRHLRIIQSPALLLQYARASLIPDTPVCGESGIPVDFAYYDPISLNYTLDYTIDGAAQPTINVTSLPYTLPTPISGVYKLTNFTFNNGANTGVVDTTAVQVYDPPMFADAGLDQSLCGVSGTVLAGNDPAPYSGLWTILSGFRRCFG